MALRLLLILIGMVLFLTGCDHGSDAVPTVVVPDRPQTRAAPDMILPAGSRILALGDSYTIGEHSTDAERWPVQLAARLKGRNKDLGEASIVARTGWTTGQLLGAIDGTHFAAPYRLVLVQIGVNDQYEDLPVAECQKQFEMILDRAVALAGGDAHGVMVLSIPDYGVTPFGQRAGGAAASQGVAEFNAMEKQVCLQRQIAYVDITPESRTAKDDPTLLASDGLHPSGKMYSAWVELTLPAVEKAVGR